MIYSYIIVSGGPLLSSSTLGHEIFFTRKITLMLLYNKLINKDTTIVTSSFDRKFLYQNYFGTTLTYEEYKLIPNTDSSTLNLSPYLNGLSLNGPVAHGKTSSQLQKIGLNKEYLVENDIFQNINTPEFNKFICNLNYTSLKNNYNVINRSFIVIHIRPTSKHINYLLKFIEYCNLNKNLGCIIFTTIENIKYPCQTNNLQIYASLMNHANCKCLLSEFSGGGQLSQFCAKKVIYYYDYYPYHLLRFRNRVYEAKNNKNFFENFDHYNPIQCKKIFINNEELTNMDKLLTYILN